MLNGKGGEVPGLGVKVTVEMSGCVDVFEMGVVRSSSVEAFSGRS